jgi:hypothetical protein
MQHPLLIMFTNPDIVDSRDHPHHPCATHESIHAASTFSGRFMDSKWPLSVSRSISVTRYATTPPSYAYCPSPPNPATTHSIVIPHKSYKWFLQSSSLVLRRWLLLFFFKQISLILIHSYSSTYIFSSVPACKVWTFHLQQSYTLTEMQWTMWTITYLSIFVIRKAKGG